MSTQQKRKLFPYRSGIILGLAVSFLFPLGVHAKIPNHVFNRIFLIKWNDSTGTAFVIDRESKQYLVTARHVVVGLRSGNAIKVFQDGKWKNLIVSVVGSGKGAVDLAVLAPSIRLSSSLPLGVSSDSLAYGHPIYFLGYPFGRHSGNEQFNRGLPLPLVKAGIVSALTVDNGVLWIILDAHVNKGFSGGPVLFIPDGKSRDELQVVGVVTSYASPELRPIVNRKRGTITDGQGDPIGYVTDNPGIGKAISIRHALELIDANPIGFQLPAARDGQ